MAIFSICAVINSALAEETEKQGFFREKFTDPEDGYFDTSEWLLEDRMFLPVPIVITEPAVGFGLGAALVFFHETNKPIENQQQDAAEEVSGMAHGLPPSLTAVAGAYTENDSWFGGVLHQGTYKQDTVRYTGSLFYPSVNLTFYGGGDTPILKNGLDYNLEGWATIQELSFRLGKSNFFLGGRVAFFDSLSTFKTSQIIPGIGDAELATDNLGAGLVLSYDSRDNIFTPNTGWDIDTRVMAHTGESITNFDYYLFYLLPRYYWQVSEKWNLGFRFQGEFTSGDVPFYALPFISLRGIPVMRYQGEDAVVAEIEARWNLNHRWSLIGFGGVGTTTPVNGNLGDDENHAAGGVGFRYLIARKLGLYTGIDVARGPEETAVYIQVGSAWNNL